MICYGVRTWGPGRGSPENITHKDEGQGKMQPKIWRQKELGKKKRRSKENYRPKCKNKQENSKEKEKKKLKRFIKVR